MIRGGGEILETSPEGIHRAAREVWEPVFNVKPSMLAEFFAEEELADIASDPTARLPASHAAAITIDPTILDFWLLKIPGGYEASKSQ